MKTENLEQKHFEAIQKRGLINDNTTKYDFLRKIREEMNELNKVLYENIESKELSEKEKQEGIDLIMTVRNMFQYFKVDYNEELAKNTDYQIKRK